MAAALVDVKNYFRARGIAEGLKEWPDPFNIKNIPENIIDRAFHVELGDMKKISFNQQSLDLAVPCAFKFFLKGFIDVNSKYDDATTILENIILGSLKASNRLTQTNIKNVEFSNGKLSPIDDSNDNTILGEINFNCHVILNPG